MIYVLRLIHILAGAFWFGTVVFVARLLMPALRSAGPGGGAVMATLGRTMPKVMMGSAILTILAGLWLMSIVSGGDMHNWMQTGPGRTFALGGALGIATILVGMAINLPTTRRMGAINAAIGKRGGPPSADESAQLARLQNRLGIGSQVVLVLLTLALAAMAVARYVP